MTVKKHRSTTVSCSSTPHISNQTQRSIPLTAIINRLLQPLKFDWSAKKVEPRSLRFQTNSKSPGSVSRHPTCKTAFYRFSNCPSLHFSLLFVWFSLLIVLHCFPFWFISDGFGFKGDGQLVANCVVFPTFEPRCAQRQPKKVQISQTFCNKTFKNWKPNLHKHEKLFQKMLENKITLYCKN